MIKQILDDLVAAEKGVQAAIFLDGEGETISQSGDRDIDLQLIGAWKEIQLDRIKDICRRLRFGEVRSVLYTLDQRSELVIPVEDEYCLLIFLSMYANFHVVLKEARNTIERLKKDIG